MTMTENQKEIICDVICKYRENADRIGKASLENPECKELKLMREGAEQALHALCEGCIVNTSNK